MLPELINVYAFFTEKIDRAVADSHKEQLKPFQGTRNRVLHEGNDFEKDAASDNPTWKHFEETVYLTHDEISELSLDELIHKFADIGTSIGGQFAQLQCEVIRKQAEKTGQLVQQDSDEDLTETLLRLFETVDPPESSGSFTLFIPPGKQAQFEEAMMKIDQTPHLRKRKKAIEDAAFERQRRREANRKLVD